MSNQKQQRSDNFPGELPKPSGKMESLLPGYITALLKLCQMSEEFKCRLSVSHVQALVQKVKADYLNYQLETPRSNLCGKMTDTIANLAWQATGQQTMAYTTPLQACVSAHPTGRIYPGLPGDFS